jgi:hypothetical protein
MKKNLLLTVAVLALVPYAAFADNTYNYGTSAASSSDSSAATVADTSPSASYSSTNTFLGMDGPYVQLQGGWNKTDDEGAADYDGGWVGGVAVGGKMPWARGELEVSYRNNDIETAVGGDVDSVGLHG